MRGREYLVGTEVQGKNGAVRKKIGGGLDGGAKWISRGRYNYMHQKGIDLTSNQRVFHIDGDRENDDPSNLTHVTFSSKVYNLKTSRVVWEPKKIAKAKPYMIKDRNTKQFQVI